MNDLNLILLLLLIITIGAQLVYPFLKGFYDGYNDAQNGRPFNEDVEKELNNKE